ncbi:MAG: NusG domain II-containing protein [Solobacterium sp.]|jgi:hypothetical protein|nr:NusG domain II-containing protein [Solobacterium sp.]
MKKKEIKILLIVAVIAVAAIIGVKWYQKANTPAETVQMVNITHDDKVVQTFDPNVNATYRIQGDYGTLDVEVKDGKWHVTNEECPNHICSSMGWSSVDDSFPIVCVPNGVVIMLESSGS